ncbi:WD repeat-containing protein 73 isoform X2 [Callorhinchus milii]|uniref:WD repeat-containing protein 73 isoform X2 n=1 Tax=Callorhinchus milii TaxID=7868 RepID=UPI0004572C75|nr:WD repeat-containing protein 73 isoform X2 [Callorhinchus milii]|eukprot:gi/632976651/ref/XP_007904914.1/ PREDICTED: WD repeat-containing protein 73 isoform X2 [Callorhinchus milii]
MESEREAWMLDSIQQYNDLYVFELQDPTQVIEWIQDRSVCVAGYDTKKRNEILQLSLPPKLCAGVRQGLCPERDFRVEHGGFSNRPVHQLKHVSGTRLLVSAGPPDASLLVWRVGAEERDTIELVSTIHSPEETWPQIATSCSLSPRLLHGSQLNNVKIHDVETQKLLFTLDSALTEPLSGLHLTDSDTFVLCSARDGCLWLGDWRQRPALAGSSEVPASMGRASRWVMAPGPGPDLSLSPTARLSSAGSLVLTDLRDFNKPLSCAEMKLSSHSPNPEHLCVARAPCSQGCLSVSGFDGTVHVYESSAWTVASGEVQPLFVHRGHAVRDCDDEPSAMVTKHVWHPNRPHTILSAATDGSFHIWNWVQPSSHS